ADLCLGEDFTPRVGSNVPGDDILPNLAMNRRQALLLAALDQNCRCAPDLEGGVILPGKPLTEMKKTLRLSCPVIAADVCKIGVDPDLVQTSFLGGIVQEFAERCLILVEALRLLGLAAAVRAFGTDPECAASTP